MKRYVLVLALLLYNITTYSQIGTFLWTTGKVYNCVVPIVSCNKSDQFLFISMYYVFQEPCSTTNKYEWYNIDAQLPGFIALYDSEGKCIKSKNNMIISLYNNNPKTCEIYRVANKRYGFKPTRLDKKKNILVEACSFVLNHYYDVKAGCNYTLIIRPLLYRANMDDGECELMTFSDIEVKIKLPE